MSQCETKGAQVGPNKNSPKPISFEVLNREKELKPAIKSTKVAYNYNIQFNMELKIKNNLLCLLVSSLGFLSAVCNRLIVPPIGRDLATYSYLYLPYFNVQIV